MNQNNRYHETNRCSFPTAFPPQHQDEQPGLEYIMKPLPMSECCKPHRKLENKIALITGGDSDCIRFRKRRCQSRCCLL